MPNLLFIRRSRPKPQAGDVFRMHHSSGGWLFGRVILPAPPERCGPMPGALLLYYYAGLRDVAEPLPEWLDARSLLIPPVWTNTLAWRHGFYETLRNVPLGPGEILDRHVFWKRDLRDQRVVLYVDECRRSVDPPAGPSSLFALYSYRSIDDDISDALGVPQAPLDDQDRAELARRPGLAKP